MPDPPEPDAAGPELPGAPVGRRIVLGMVGLAAIGVVVGSKVSSALTAVAQQDPTGLLGLVPGNGRFRFYSVAGRVDDIPADTYRLTVDGMVRHPGSLTFDDLSRLPQTEITRDVQCVTGWRVPDVRWTGVLLRDVLAHVGTRAGAGGVTFGSSDRVYSESLTMEQSSRPDVLIAMSLNGEPVSNNHGGPVRLYVAPMYFYKSIKWLDRITVVDRVQPGFWERRGYDVDAWVGQSNGRSDAPVA